MNVEGVRETYTHIWACGSIKHIFPLRSRVPIVNWHQVNRKYFGSITYLAYHRRGVVCVNRSMQNERMHVLLESCHYSQDQGNHFL